jgi:hypothetical protein
MLQPFYSQGKYSRYSLDRRPVRSSVGVNVMAKRKVQSLPSVNPDSPSCNQSFYWLSCPSSHTMNLITNHLQTINNALDVWTKNKCKLKRVRTRRHLSDKCFQFTCVHKCSLLTTSGPSESTLMPCIQFVIINVDWCLKYTSAISSNFCQQCICDCYTSQVIWQDASPSTQSMRATKSCSMYQHYYHTPKIIVNR